MLATGHTLDMRHRLENPDPNDHICESGNESIYMEERDGFHSVCGQAFIRVPSGKRPGRCPL
jgi:hypothetical protein